MKKLLNWIKGERAPRAPRYGREWEIPAKDQRRVCTLIGKAPKMPEELFDFWAEIGKMVPETKGIKCVVDFRPGQVPYLREVL